MALQVLGSINLDAVMTVHRLPQPGETVAAKALVYLPGGKGANQAVAAARMGARTTLIGAVGQDSFGDEMIAFLREAGVGTARIRRIADQPTGTAHVWIDETGENQIVVASGANAGLDPGDIEGAGELGGLRLAQLETPIPIVRAFLETGHRDGGCCILNAAPALEGGAALFPLADILILNETEASRYLGLSALPAAREEMGKLMRGLMTRDDQHVILTLGAAGVLLIENGTVRHIPARPVQVVDTTGAGDCFCGVLAACLDTGALLQDAILRAMAAAAIVVQRMGAAVAMPGRDEIRI